MDPISDAVVVDRAVASTQALVDLRHRRGPTSYSMFNRNKSSTRTAQIQIQISSSSTRIHSSSTAALRANDPSSESGFESPRRALDQVRPWFPCIFVDM